MFTFDKRPKAYSYNKRIVDNTIIKSNNSFFSQNNKIIIRHQPNIKDNKLSSNRRLIPEKLLSSPKTIFQTVQRCHYLNLLFKPATSNSTSDAISITIQTHKTPTRNGLKTTPQNHNYTPTICVVYVKQYRAESSYSMIIHTYTLFAFGNQTGIPTIHGGRVTHPQHQSQPQLLISFSDLHFPFHRHSNNPSTTTQIQNLDPMKNSQYCQEEALVLE